jgi:hypothetical protein
MKVRAAQKFRCLCTYRKGRDEPNQPSLRIRWRNITLNIPFVVVDSLPGAGGVY